MKMKEKVKVKLLPLNGSCPVITKFNGKFQTKTQERKMSLFDRMEGKNTYTFFLILLLMMLDILMILISFDKGHKTNIFSYVYEYRCFCAAYFRNTIRLDNSCRH